MYDATIRDKQSLLNANCRSETIDAECMSNGENLNDWLRIDGTYVNRASSNEVVLRKRLKKRRSINSTARK